MKDIKLTRKQSFIDVLPSLSFQMHNQSMRQELEFLKFSCRSHDYQTDWHTAT